MEATHQSKASRSGRFADIVKDSDRVPSRSKQPVSAAGIFKQNVKSVKKMVPPPILHPSAMKKPTRGKLWSTSSPNKTGRSGFRKQDDLHPLAAAFNDTTQAYRNALYENTTKRLDDTLSHLLTQLHDCNITTVSSPPGTADPTCPPQKVTLAEKADRTAEKLFRRIGSYNVTTAKKVHGEVHCTEKTLEEELEDFAARHKACFEELHLLEKKWETVVGEIWKVGVNCLGEDAMSALLLTRPSPPSSSPTRRREDGLALDDLEPKPARKKVKFQEPMPELPSFLYAASVYLDLPIPAQVSKEDIKKLEDRVNALGTPQINELVKIKNDQNKSWVKKMKELMDILGE